jgi:hypothetical protein
LGSGSLWGQVSLERVEFNNYLGTVSIDAEVNQGWGRNEWGSLAWGIAGTVLASSQQITSSIGTVTAEAQVAEGWGREEWGEFAWGDNYSVIPQGQQLTSAQGTVIPRTDVSVTAASQQILSITQGLESIQIDADIFVFVGEPGLSSTQGTTTETGTASVSVTGQSLTTGVGQAWWHNSRSTCRCQAYQLH